MLPLVLMVLAQTTSLRPTQVQIVAPVDGGYSVNVTLTGTSAVTGPLTDAQLRATPVPVSGTVTVGTFPDNEPVNVAQMNGVAVTMGNGISGTGVQRVAIASDNTAFSVNANAGTNLNTSALNLEATQAAMSAKLPATLGQKAMAASMAVVLASDQSAVPISGSVAATQSGTWTATQGPSVDGGVPWVTEPRALATEVRPTLTEGQYAPLSTNLQGQVRTDTTPELAALRQLLETLIRLTEQQSLLLMELKSPGVGGRTQ